MILKRELYQRHGYIKGLYIILFIHLRRVFHYYVGSDGPLHRFFNEKKVEVNEKHRGMLALTVKESGELQCNSCNLCQTYCPADCIHIVPGKKTETPEAFEIEILRCVFCGLCEEACPIDAIRHTPEMPRTGHAEQDWLVGIKELAYRKSLNGGKGLLSKVHLKAKRPLEKNFKNISPEA